MDDNAIIDLYWKRSEKAIWETDAKYGSFCHSLAYSILANREDAEESVNDTYLAVWNAIPPQRPSVLMAFLAAFTRRISISRWRAISAHKRGGGQVQLALEELLDCASREPDAERIAMGKEAYHALNRFLDRLPYVERTVFVRRYFLLDTASEIGKNFGFTESKVHSMLHRTRMKLKAHLAKEGYL